MNELQEERFEFWMNNLPECLAEIVTKDGVRAEGKGAIALVFAMQGNVNPLVKSRYLQ